MKHTRFEAGYHHKLSIYIDIEILLNSGKVVIQLTWLETG